MPNFGINDAPVQISQTGTQEALIKNTGNSTLFLDQYSSVSSANHGLSLEPLSSVNWAEGRDLWAVTAAGTETSVSVLYGATGTSLSEVSAVVTGDVTATIDGTVNANITNASIPVTGNVNAAITNASIPVTGNVNAAIINASIPVTGTVNANITNANIDATVTGNIVVDSGTVNVGGILTPVQVQGGGAVLLNQTGTINANSGLNIDIPGPASGLTYYGLGVIVTNTSKTVTNDVPFDCYLRNFGLGTGVPATRFLVGIVGSVELGEFGSPSVTSVAVPVASAFPIRLELDNNAVSGNMGYRVIAIGLSNADNVASDFGQWENGAETEVSFDSAPANSFAVIAPSFTRREYLLVSATGSVGNFVVDVLVSDGTWITIQSRAHNSLYGGNVGAANVQANANSLITIPGDGRTHRIRNLTAVTGTVRLTYLGKNS